MENQNQDQNQSQENKPKIQMYEVHSTKVSKVGWYFCQQSFQGVMIAEFPKGARYMYYPVAKDLFSGIFSAKSKGQYFTDNIQNNKAVNYKKLGQEKLEL